MQWLEILQNEVAELTEEMPELTPHAVLTELISYYEPVHRRYKNRYARYKGDKKVVPIYKRELPDFMKVNNKIHNNFLAEAVDTKVGYMIGIPVTYSIQSPELRPDLEDVDSEVVKKEKQGLREIQNKISEFNEHNNIHDMNVELIKYTSICGTASRLAYVSSRERDQKLNTYRIKNLKPWETIFVYTDDEYRATVALRYYRSYRRLLDGRTQSYVVVEVYDDEYRYVYHQNESSQFVPKNMFKIRLVGEESSFEKTVEVGGEEEFVFVNYSPHMLNGVPLVEFPNNQERQGDCDKALDLMEVYDKCISDWCSEIEQFRLAYLVLYGLKMDEKDIDKLRQTGCLEMTKDGKVEFITKKLDVESITANLNKLETNIVRLTKSVNFKDENFYGNLSGVAIRYKLMQLEEKASVTQVKFETSDAILWGVLETGIGRYARGFKAKMVGRQFTRNIPVNMLEEARIQSELEGKVSTKKRLSVASFVHSPELEQAELMEELKTRAEFNIDFDKVNKPAVKLSDVEAGGQQDRNTNGTLDEL